MGGGAVALPAAFEAGYPFVWAESELRRDPLASWVPCSLQQARLLAESCEVHFRGANSSGKTTGGAAKGVALARGKRELASIALPPIATPNTGWVLVKTRKQQVESAQQAYLSLLGDYPHTIAWSSRALNYIELIRVKPEGCKSDNPEDWSTIRFHCEESDSTVGGRVDWVHADEPPSERIWREARMRKRAGSPLYLWITETPLERTDWEWLRQEFAGCMDAEKDGKLEIVSTVYDNRFLSKADIAFIEQKVATDAWADARLRGEYVDTTNACPFGFHGLQRWLGRCVPAPKRFQELEVWYGPEKGEEYFVLADPSAGIEDSGGLHDPAGIHVTARKRPALVARYVGYSDASSLGVMAARVAHHYNRGMVVPEMNGGYGEAFLLGLGDYGNVYIRERAASVGAPLGSALGWVTTATTRGWLIAALQKAVREDGLEIWSREAVESLMSTIMDPAGRIVAMPRHHDEDMILLGMACHLLETMPVREAQPRKPGPWSEYEALRDSVRPWRPMGVHKQLA